MTDISFWNLANDDDKENKTVKEKMVDAFCRMKIGITICKENDFNDIEETGKASIILNDKRA